MDHGFTSQIAKELGK